MFIKPDKTILARGFWVLGGAFILWAILIFRLFWLQVLDYDKYHALVIDNITAKAQISAARGIIYDCNMTELAVNTTVSRVFISPCDIRNDEEKDLISRYLSDLFGIEYSTVYEKAEKSWRADETIKNYVEKETADKIRTFINENGLTCIHLEDQTKRYYPFGSLAAHVIGFTNSEGAGVYGLEYQYNDYLTGVAGQIITSVNASGGSIPTKYESYTEASSGYNIVSTIDYKIQSILETYVKQSYYDQNAQNRCCGIVMECKTGAILGMATYPPFDLNDPYTFNEETQAQIDAFVGTDEEYTQMVSTLRTEMWNNMAISTLYEPGSTFKIITSAMGFEEGVIKDTDEFTCTDPFYVPLNDSGAKQKVSCWHAGGHGTVTYRRGLQQSCNPTLMQAAWLIGADNFMKYVQAFGYTAKTGIDLPGESKGIFHAASNLNILELSTASFGQNFKTTAIQQLTAICAVANGGTLVTPYVVSRLVDDEGNTVKDCTPDAKRVLVSEDTCTLITDILTEGVSTDGAAKNAYVKGYKVAGKTGTSQKTDKRDENGDVYLYTGSCVAYGPSDDPQVAVLILCDEPAGDSIYGSVVAAPYVAKAMAEILPYMNIDPVYTEDELASMEVNVSNYIGMSTADAITALNNKGLTYKIYGEGDTVTQQIPKSGSTVIQSSGIIVLYTEGITPTESVTIPNLTGYTISGATKVMVDRGLNIILEGATQSYSATDSYAQAVSQSIPENTKVAPGTVMTVEFRFTDARDG